MYIIEVIVMRRHHYNIFYLAIYSAVIILVVCIIPYLLPRIPGRPEFFNERIINSIQQDEIKELKEEALKEYHLRFDYDDVLGCKTGEPPWDCGIENLMISDVYSQKYAFLPKKKIGKYYKYIIDSYRNKQGYTINLYVAKEEMPHRYTQMPTTDYREVKYTIDGKTIITQLVSDRDNRVLSFYMFCEDWYGYKLQGNISYYAQEYNGDNVTNKVKEILDKTLNNQ
ncbi:hypothetical protein [uncultured Solobacterium sp.]|jgi:hypothetical protein|uniref:hypothetical protein n=1 Tax=uncultured Solobacterium sp. TaxID=747375 RepID=UPI00262C6F1C|nr:hypothetical protein [uncultured Solobacterium sp.]